MSLAYSGHLTVSYLRKGPDPCQEAHTREVGQRHRVQKSLVNVHNQSLVRQRPRSHSSDINATEVTSTMLCVPFGEENSMRNVWNTMLGPSVSEIRVSCSEVFLSLLRCGVGVV